MATANPKETIQPQSFSDPHAALSRVTEIYRRSTALLRARFAEFASGHSGNGLTRAGYPYVRVRTDTVARADSRQAFGFVAGPGDYRTTLTRPDLFERYYLEQFALLIGNHGVALEIGESDTPIPMHFAFEAGEYPEAALNEARQLELRDLFDAPDLGRMDDRIANGDYEPVPGEPQPLALFDAPRVDYSLHRLKHYTGTSVQHFQNYVLFTNYQFYVDEFVRMGRQLMAAAKASPSRSRKNSDDANSADDYVAFVEPGDVITPRGKGNGDSGTAPARLPQMPAYHLQRADCSGITLVNIGVGPSNAKTITDHIAVLRPHAWLMLGHCAGLRNTQKLGDYVLAHGYVREDHVLDADLPPWVPIPALAEIQLTLEAAVASVTKLEGYDLKRVMRTGTVASVDNRNWELRPYSELLRKFNQSRAIALDMESATIAANGFRFRVPYGTLLCVSDKPLHGELKLPGMADQFYRQRVNQHLEIGVLALDTLRGYGMERLHSRKLRSFAEVAFQ
jgi:AMP nucleosidase